MRRIELMRHPIRLYHLLSIVERKHGLFELDPPCRSLLDIVTQREIAGIETTAEDLVGGSDLSRATVYRKIKLLKTNGSLVESWSGRNLIYHIGENIKAFCDEIRASIVASSSE